MIEIVTVVEDLDIWLETTEIGESLDKKWDLNMETIVILQII